MTGFEDDEFGAETFRPAPHPDDRLWRHPAEMAAAKAAGQTPAEPTVELPAIAAGEARGSGPLRVHWGLLAAAVAVAVGASAMTIGLLTARSTDDGAAASTANDGTDIGLIAAADTDAATGSAGATPVVHDTESSAQAEGVESIPADQLRRLLEPSLPRVQAATGDGVREGSGIFVSADGLIVTSAAVVADAEYILAWTNDGRRLHATLVASDPFSDVALLRVETNDTQPASFSDTPMASADIDAMVFDHGARSLNAERVGSTRSSVPGAVPGDESTRVSIGGNSTGGGPLPGSAIVDGTGRVIAVVNGQSNLGSEQASTRATPAWLVQRVVAELLEDGSADHPWLGIQVRSEPDHMSSTVTGVIADSPAASAGIQPGDIIDSVNGVALSESLSLWTLVQMQEPGDRIDLELRRDGTVERVSVRLAQLGN
ncbi:MAG: trypsin-like peptidase domain-containing protein [Actinomycetota bacterium]